MTQTIVYNTEKNKRDGKLPSPSDFQKAHIARCAKDPIFFITQVCKTIDEKDSNNPIKKFPNKKHLKLLIKEIHKYDLSILEKTRQMTVTWSILLYITWDCIFNQGRKWFVQSKKEEDSDAHLDRIKATLDLLPEWLIPRYKKRYCKIIFKHSGSEIKAVAQNPDAYRQYTASGVFVDEDEEQENYESCITSILPMTKKLISVGTAKGVNYKHKLMTGEALDADTKTIKDVYEEKGIRFWTNGANWRCMRIHYSSDPEKNNKEWIEKEKNKVSDFMWEQEYEINRTVSSGKRVFPEFNKDTHTCDLDFNRIRILYRGWDYGFHHPGVVFFQFDDQGRCLVLDEILGKEETAHEFIGRVAQYTFDNYKGAKCLDYGDPAGEQTTDKGPKTTVQIARDFGIRIKSKKRSIAYGIELISELLKLRTDKQPALLIDHKCELLNSAFLGGYAWKKDRFGNYLEEPNKDGYYDHLMDAFRYGITGTVNRKTLEPKRFMVGNKQSSINKTLYADDKVFNRFGKESFSGYGIRNARKKSRR